MEIHSEDYQEAGSEQSGIDESSRHIMPVIEEDRSSASENALMIRPIAGPLQVFAGR
ncbi:MAG: hypothetical protein IH612_04205 [Desulfofustis sp.]|nr:hypothetical protein [Desulfofustis sp.]